MKNLKRGFTLAEVLITLTIIGIVAAITLPALNTNGNYQVFNSRLSKFFSVTEDATTALAASEGVVNINDIDSIVLYTKRTGNAPTYTYNLKDGTTMEVATGGELPTYVEIAKYGTGVAKLIFTHNAKVPNAQESLEFVVTTKGYLFPEKNDTCANHLFNGQDSKNMWKLTKADVSSSGKCKKS